MGLCEYLKKCKKEPIKQYFSFIIHYDRIYDQIVLDENNLLTRDTLFVTFQNYFQFVQERLFKQGCWIKSILAAFERGSTLNCFFTVCGAGWDGGGTRECVFPFSYFCKNQDPAYQTKIKFVKYIIHVTIFNPFEVFLISQTTRWPFSPILQITKTLIT